MNILLMDDDPLLRHSVSKLIQYLGNHFVYTTDSPSDLFQQCQSGLIDLVMMDIRLPGATWQERDVDGIELSRLLKSDRKTAHLPILLFTAYALDNEQQTFLSASQADAICTKPVKDYGVILDLINRLSQKANSEAQ